MLIDASVVARLLGIRLLRIEAALTLSPARIVAPARPTRRMPPIGADLGSARREIELAAEHLRAVRTDQPSLQSRDSTLRERP